MKRKQRILFVCIASLHRSPTAEQLYKNDPRYEVRSAGAAPHAIKLLTEEDLSWADEVFVMDQIVLEIIKALYPKIDSSSFINLEIPDVYDTSSSRQKEELISILKQKLAPYLGKPRGS